MPDRIYIELERGLAEEFVKEWDRGQGGDMYSGVPITEVREVLRAALASQESGEGRCGGSGLIPTDDPHLTQAGVTQEYCPGCPDCQPQSAELNASYGEVDAEMASPPQSGEGEDWPEIDIARDEDGAMAINTAGREFYADPAWSFRRYIPAPEGSEG